MQRERNRSYLWSFSHFHKLSSPARNVDLFRRGFLLNRATTLFLVNFASYKRVREPENKLARVLDYTSLRERIEAESCRKLSRFLNVCTIVPANLSRQIFKLITEVLVHPSSFKYWKEKRILIDLLVKIKPFPRFI